MAPIHDPLIGSSFVPFDRRQTSGAGQFTRLGGGAIGAKAGGLACASRILGEEIVPQFQSVIGIDIPPLGVIATDWFDLFMEQNGLYDLVGGAAADDQITAAFQRARLPEDLVADLRAFATRFNGPLAVRSSSLLEDAVNEPLAGAYATRFIPNSSPDEELRLQSLIGAIKYVYASTFFSKASGLLTTFPHRIADEKMAVIIQEAVGARHGARFYPHISGVARSMNFYPLGLSKPEDGMAQLALGFGRMIAEDGIGWSFSLSCPQANPPYGELGELVEQSQREFWAIDMKGQVERENHGAMEHLAKFGLTEAEGDGTLSFTASTYRAGDDKLLMGITGHEPRVLDFGQILKAGLLPLPALLRACLDRCAKELGTMVEIEFAMTFPDPDSTPARFSFLQVRPMVASADRVVVDSADMAGTNVLIATDTALGNGQNNSIRDIVYVRPETFDPARTKEIVQELELLNRSLVASETPYVLIGFGRWGSSDYTAGIPVNFGQVSGAKVIVESTLPCVDFMPSQGTHFFHNITCSRVLCFSVRHGARFEIDWNWLNRQTATLETHFLRHIRLPSALTVKVDGRTNRGVILKRR